MGNRCPRPVELRSQAASLPRLAPPVARRGPEAYESIVRIGVGRSREFYWPDALDRCWKTRFRFAEKIVLQPHLQQTTRSLRNSGEAQAHPPGRILPNDLSCQANRICVSRQGELKVNFSRRRQLAFTLDGSTFFAQINKRSFYIFHDSVANPSFGINRNSRMATALASHQAPRRLHAAARA